MLHVNHTDIVLLNGLLPVIIPPIQFIHFAGSTQSLTFKCKSKKHKAIVTGKNKEGNREPC